MEREIIVVTAAYGNDKVKALGGQRSTPCPRWRRPLQITI